MTVGFPILPPVWQVVTALTQRPWRMGRQRWPLTETIRLLSTAVTSPSIYSMAHQLVSGTSWTSLFLLFLWLFWKHSHVHTHIPGPKGKCSLSNSHAQSQTRIHTLKPNIHSHSSTHMHTLKTTKTTFALYRPYKKTITKSSTHMYSIFS